LLTFFLYLLADVLRLAIDAVPEAERTGSNKHLVDLYSGVKLTRENLLKTFQRAGVEEYEPKEGEKFDPNVHDALFQAPIPNKEPGTIASCSKTGFKINDRILRPAQVGVVREP
jgi:molecular chaperone GrpE